MSMGGKLLRGSVLRTVDLGVLLIASFLVTPMLVHAFGNRLYGFWSLVGAIAGYYGFLDLGMTAAATKYMSEAAGRRDADEVNRIASTAHVLFTGAALIVLAVTGVSVLLCPRFISEPGERLLFQQLLVIVGAAAALQFPVKVYTGMLTAGLRYDRIALISVGRSLLLNGGIFLALRSGLGVLTVALLTLAVTALQRAAIRSACLARFPELRVSISSFDPARARVMFAYGWKILVCQIGDILRFRLDSVVIAAFLGAAAVTPYAVAVRLAEGFAQLVASFTGTMLPVFSRYQGQGDHTGMRSALLKVTKLSAVMTTFLGASLAFYGRPFIERWMGPGFETSYFIAVILAAAYVIGLPQSPGIQLLYGVSKHEAYAALSVCEGLVNLGLSVALMRWFGLYGVALGTLVEMALFKLVILPIYLCRVTGIPLRVYLGETILLTQLKTAAVLAIYFYAVSSAVTASYHVIAGYAVLQTALFAPIGYFLILGAAERGSVSSALRNIFVRERPTLEAVSE